MSRHLDLLGFEPMHSLVARRFRDLVADTQCIYAPQARIWGTRPWSDGSTLDRYIDLNVDVLECFAQSSETDELDGLVLEVRGAEHLSSIEAFARCFRQIVDLISHYDSSLYISLTEKINDKSWRLKLFDVDVFVATFAPFYGPDSSRYSSYPDTGFVFIQPEGSFKRRKVNSLAKRRIRKNFETAGRPYSAKIAGGKYHARKFVKPLEVGDDVIEWWTGPQTDQLASFEIPTAPDPNCIRATHAVARASMKKHEFARVIGAMTPLHRLHPDARSFQHTILDALYAMGSTEDDFEWSSRPEILRLGAEVSDRCFDYLDSKRKPRTIQDLQQEFAEQTYWWFTGPELLEHLERDPRFVVVGCDVRTATVTTARER